MRHTRARNPSNLAHGEWCCLRLFVWCGFRAGCFAVCPAVCLAACLVVCLAVCLVVCLVVCLDVCLDVCFAAAFGGVAGWGGWAAGGRESADGAACGTAAFTTPAGPRPSASSCSPRLTVKPTNTPVPSARATATTTKTWLKRLRGASGDPRKSADGGRTALPRAADRDVAGRMGTEDGRSFMVASGITLRRLPSGPV